MCNSGAEAAWLAVVAAWAVVDEAAEVARMALAMEVVVRAAVVAVGVAVV